jgi:hypothetical protein
MLSPGNTKLGRGRRIWTFSLPSRTSCPGRSPLCARQCYAYRIERRPPSVRRRYQRNRRLSRRPDFVARVAAFLVRRQVHVVRLHVSGDFPSPAYARKWLAVMRRLPGVRFYFYTRSWRVPSIRRVLAAMAWLPNVRAWFSAGRQTGVPGRLPAGVRLAWLMTAPDDLPPRADLVFRVRPLWRLVRKRVGWEGGAGQALVCPTENGATGRRTSCELCGVCWRGPAPPSPARFPMPVIAHRVEPGMVPARPGKFLPGGPSVVTGLREEQAMSARSKLNGAYAVGALLVAGLLGLLTGSGTVFLVSLVGLLVADLIAGHIRLPRSPR